MTIARTLRPLPPPALAAYALPSPPRLSVLLAMLAVSLQLTVSANLLYVMGIHYEVAGGNPVFKIHPATYLAVLAVLIRLYESGDPVAALLRLLAANRLLGVFLGGIMICIVYSLASVGVTGSAAYIDSYLSAGALMLVLADATLAQRRQLGFLMLALFQANITLAIFEDVTHRELIPFYIGAIHHVSIAGNFRGTALYDHPLTGAMMTSMGMFLLLQMRLRPLVTIALVGWTLVGLFAFGGRASLVATVCALLGLGAWSLCADLLTRRLTATRILAIIGALLLGLAIAWIVITQTAIADRIVKHAYLDSSAEAREVEWLIPGLMSARELMFGVKVDRLPQIVYQLGLVYPFTDVENFWLLAFINLGIVGFAIYLTAFLAYLVDLWRRVPLFGRVMLVVIIAVASTSNSLGRKSNILFVLTGTLIATTGFAARRDAEPVTNPRPASRIRTRAAPSRALTPLASR